MATSSSSKVTLKLLIDKKTRKVLFAEAGKEFVDFLFTIFSLPLGSVTKLLSSDNMVGCLGNLYKSIQDLNDTFIQPTMNKDTVLSPSCSAMNNNNLLLSNRDDDNHESVAKQRKKFYLCHSCYKSPPIPNPFQIHELFVADKPQAVCPHCKQAMSYEAKLIVTAAPDQNVVGITKVDGESGGGGFVKGVVTYMVMDNLEVRPMSTISSITLLNKFNIQEVGSLQEKVIELGMAEGLKLLKASLSTKTVLTTVFLESS